MVSENKLIFFPIVGKPKFGFFSKFSLSSTLRPVCRQILNTPAFLSGDTLEFRNVS